MILWKCFRRARISLLALLIVACATASATAQNSLQDTLPQETRNLPASSSGAPSASNPKSDASQQPPDKHAFGLLPNYRSAKESDVYTPIPVSQKFLIASQDSFDYAVPLLGAISGGFGQLTDQNPSFGQGLKGYARRLGTSCGDQIIGNMMTEGILPTLLREDPRYFVRGSGSKWSRTYYAVTRIFVIRTDSGKKRFNFSEVLGNATAVAISNAYYPDGRNAASNASRLGLQLGIDALSQVLKEFWPDIQQRLSRRHGAKDSP